MDKRRWVAAGLLLVLAAALAACVFASGGTGSDGDKGDDLESLAGGFTFRREGGIAGFCDIVSVAAGDSAEYEADVATCRAEPPDALGSMALSAEQAERLDELVRRLGSFEREQSDPATADGMTIIIDFTGLGDAQPTDADLAAIEELALAVLRDYAR